MKRLLLTLLLTAWAGAGWGATYYVDCTSGSDANGGTHPTTDAWATMGKAWETLVTGTHTVEVTAGNCYAEDNALGGADPGETLTFSASGGTVNVRIVDATAASVFQAAAGQTGTNIFSGAFVFDQGTHGDSSAVSLKYFFNAGAVNNITYELRDVELHASGATSNKPFNANSGLTGVLFKAVRSHIHDFNAPWDDDGQVYLEACFIENWYRFDPDGSAAITLHNNTWNVGASANNRVRLTGAGGTSAAIDIRNNLFYSSIAAGTGWIPLEIQSSGYTDLTISSNVAWKTGTPTWTDTDSWGYLYAPSGAVSNSMLALDPSFDTAPAIATTSPLIGTGAATGVTTSYNGEAITTPTIGAHFPSGATAYAHTNTSKKVLVVGDSWCDGDMTSGGDIGQYLSTHTDLSTYTFVELPGRSNTLACLSGAKLERLFGLMTALAIQETPEFIVYHGGLNDHGAYNEAVLDEQVDAFFAFCDSVGVNACVYGGAQPDDGVAPVVTTVAEAIEAGITGCTDDGHACAGLTAKWITDNDWGTYYAADPLHPAVAGYQDYADLLATKIASLVATGGGGIIGGGLIPGMFGMSGGGGGAASSPVYLAWGSDILYWGSDALHWGTE